MVAPRFGLLVNSLPRARDSRVKAAALRTALHRQGAQVVVPRATGPAELVAAARGLVEAGAVDALVACGGDGMVHAAVQAVGGTGVPLGVLPAGTGCDFARAVGLLGCADPEIAAVQLLRGRIRTLDLGRCQYGWFASILNAGFDARITVRAGAMRVPPLLPLGRAKYDVALLPELAVFRPTALTVELDTQTLELDALLVAVGNTSHYGGGMQMCPGAMPDDGRLEVVVVSHAPRREVLGTLLSVYRGGHLANRHVTSYQSRHVRVVSHGPVPEVATADGEVLGPLPVDCEAVPGALQLLG